MENAAQKKISGNRIMYFDTLRFIAMFVIYVTHFISKFHGEYFSLWKTFPTSLFLNGVTGKMGVALFGVILGYFAYSSREENATRYVIKRYAFFAISGFVINFVYAFAGWMSPDFAKHSVTSVVMESLTLGDGIYATYWCIPTFFIASVISYVNGKAKASSLVIIIEAIMFYSLGQVWIAACLIGNLVARYEKTPEVDFLKYRGVRVLLWVILFFAIKRPGSNLTYLIDGVCCSVMLMLIMRGNVVKGVLDNKFTGFLGKQGMGVFILHPICYKILGPILFNWFSPLPYPLAFCMALVICFAVIVIVSIPVVKFINMMTKNVGDAVKLIQNKNRLNGTKS